jgi:hypothetical protein
MYVMLSIEQKNKFSKSFRSCDVLFKVYVIQLSLRCDAKEILGVMPRSLFFFFSVLKFPIT